MNALAQAIYSKFTASQVAGTLYALLSGRLYEVRIPAGADDYPAGTHHIVDDTPHRTFAEGLESFRVTFNFFSRTDDAAEVQTIFEACKTLFDNCDLGMTSWHTVRFARTAARFLESDKTWQYSVDYHVELQPK